MSRHVVGVVLAAGVSSRTTQHKALMQLEGCSLLARAVETLRAAQLERVLVVVGQVEAVRLEAERLGECVLNPNPERGMFSSLRVALQRLGRPTPEAVVLSLVDHPGVTTQTVERLLARWAHGGADAVVPTSAGQRGHPVVLGARVLEAIRNAPADSTLQRVLEAHAVDELPVDDAAVLQDVDTDDEARALGVSAPKGGS